MQLQPRAFVFSTDSAHVETCTLFVSHYRQMKVEDPFVPLVRRNFV